MTIISLLIESSPNVGKGGVGASDSTLRGNPVRGGRDA